MWPFKVIYAPLGLLWLYFAIKARAFWFFSPVNPTLEFSGFEGETKKEMYQQLPPNYYPKTLHITAHQEFTGLVQEFERMQFRYPVIGKPEVGMQGIMVRKLKDKEEWKAYHDHLGTDYLIQDFINLPLEFSVFHIRYPGKQKGIVTGFILKEYLQVKGDGHSTLIQLIQHHPKARYREAEMRHMHGDKLGEVIPAGETFLLSFTGNHNRGARFINLHNEIDQQLTDVFDKISNEVGSFYYGRYDLKCTSIEDLKAGKNISIIEFNGAGAEPNHIYDCGMSYPRALREVAWHWKQMFRIARINNKLGIPYWSFRRGKHQLDNTARFFAKLRQIDSTY